MNETWKDIENYEGYYQISEGLEVLTGIFITQAILETIRFHSTKGKL